MVIDLGEVIGLEEVRELASSATNKGILPENVLMGIQEEETIIEGITNLAIVSNHLLLRKDKTEKKVNLALFLQRKTKRKAFLDLYRDHPLKGKIAESLPHPIQGVVLQQKTKDNRKREALAEVQA